MCTLKPFGLLLLVPLSACNTVQPPPAPTPGQQYFSSYSPHYASVATQASQAQTSTPSCPSRFRCFELTIESAGTASETKLGQDDVKLFDAKKTIPIQFFAQEPASIGILVDTSGSMYAKLQAAREVITQFVTGLDSHDDLFLFAFSSQPFLLQPFTIDHGALLARLPMLYAQGKSALFDSIFDGMLMVRHGHYDRKALFVISDGFDNASESNEAKILNLAAQGNVSIFTLGIGEPSSGQSSWFSRKSSTVNTRILTQLAAGTAAQTYNIPISGDAEQVKDASTTLGARIENRYAMGFDASKATSTSLRLEVRNHPGAILQVEGGAITPVNVAATSAK